MVIENASWRWIFLNVPPAVIVTSIVSGAYRCRDEAPGRLDCGVLLATLGLTIIERLNWGAQFHFLSVLSGCIAIILVLAVYFVEVNSRALMMPLHHLNRVFSGANLLTSTVVFSFKGSLFFFPLI